MSRPLFIAISGVMGAGKTTLSRGLARSLQWSYAPESLSATRYLKDFFTNRQRWAFEIQTAFLVYKALQVQHILQQGHNLILDRSLFEDSEVFAHYFHSQGDIDDRSYETYSKITTHFLDSIPLPDMVIHCDCSLETAKERIPQRDKEFQRLYPPDHIDRIYQLYEEWRGNYTHSAFYGLDTLSIDTRHQTVLDDIVADVITILDQQRNPLSQGTLFDIIPEESKRSISLLKPIFIPQIPLRPSMRPVISPRRKVRVTKYPSAYVAAPFTGNSTPVKQKSNGLFVEELEHGLLMSGQYRSGLLAITRALEKMGIFPILPHRDINDWGEKKLSPRDVMELCTDYVKETDIFIGILGMSHGSHYEFGLARGLAKPAIIVNCEEISQSYISTGVIDMPEMVLAISCKKMSEIPALLLGDRSRNFLRSHIPIP